MIRMEVEKVPLQFTQVSAESSAAIGEGKARVDLANNWNYGYIGEFHLGSGTPQKIRAMFDTGSANSWIRSTEANSRKDPREVQNTCPFDHHSSPTWQEPDDNDK